MAKTSAELYAQGQQQAEALKSAIPGIALQLDSITGMFAEAGWVLSQEEIEKFKESSKQDV